jgi:hypothetical protein
MVASGIFWFLRLLECSMAVIEEPNNYLRYDQSILNLLVLHKLTGTRSAIKK